MGEKLTKAEAVRRHRQMWDWIADETLRKKKSVSELNAYNHFWTGKIKYCCWLCEYAKGSKGLFFCKKCPVSWPGGGCTNNESTALYDRFFNSEKNYLLRAEYARQIAELPERDGKV